MSPRLRAIAFCTLLLLASGHFSAQNSTLETAMRGKLLNAQRLLEAVVAVDYAGIDRSAEALSRISETEIGSWQSSPNSEYVDQAMIFLSSVQGLREAAGKRDINAVLTEYTALVSSCARCHSRVRGATLVSLEP